MNIIQLVLSGGSTQATGFTKGLYVDSHKKGFVGLIKTELYEDA